MWPLVIWPGLPRLPMNRHPQSHKDALSFDHDEKVKRAWRQTTPWRISTFESSAAIMIRVHNHSSRARCLENSFEDRIKTTEEWLGRCTGSAKQVVNPANGDKPSKFLLFHDWQVACDQLLFGSIESGPFTGSRWSMSSLSSKFMWRLDKTTQAWFGECTGSAKRVAKPANCKKISKFLIFHDRSRAIDSGLLWRFLRSKWYLNATFWIGTKFLCCVCSMLIFSYLIVRSFSPQTCFLFRSTMMFLCPPLLMRATCRCHCRHGRVTDRGWKWFGAFYHWRVFNLTPFFHNNSEHDVDLTTSGPDFTLPKGGVWRVSACLRCVHNHNRCFEGGIIKIVFIFEVIVAL